MIMRFILMGVLLTSTAPAHAGFVQQNDSIALAAISGAFDTIGEQSGLSAKDFAAAKRSAITWYHLGPCEGSTKHIDRQLAHGVISLTASPDPRSPFVAATLQMIAIMAVQNLGREAPKWLCDYVGTLATSN
ncbi:hypothetical protein GB928_018740 [Shinella curvata]|uniref:Rap1a immunity protein domain-containing protein n=1 Tax=Shinella curvata TaxID=1817964 RepID=A0ABT8XJ85_9HYPH|nr:hypothetical protein [Shinella curvata]MCJ8053898.1 hypothetical protein [Shinella curvata]MDO6123230.1 hypothetical protein [Shinella curvata]